MVGGSQQRQRGASMRQQVQQLSQQYPGQQQLSARARSSSSMKRAVSAESADDAESVAFFEDNGSMVSSVAPGGNWFLKGTESSLGNPTPAGSSAGSPKVQQAAAAGSNSTAQRIISRRGSMSIRPRSVTTVVTSDDDAPVDSLEALDRRLAKIAQSAERKQVKGGAFLGSAASNNLSFTNRSIQFALDDDDEDNIDVDADGSALDANSNSSPPPPSSLHQNDNVVRSAAGDKKTIVSNTLRQRGGSMKGLRKSPSTLVKSSTSPSVAPTAAVVVEEDDSGSVDVNGAEAAAAAAGAVDGPPKARRHTLAKTPSTGNAAALTLLPPQDLLASEEGLQFPQLKAASGGSVGDRAVIPLVTSKNLTPTGGAAATAKPQHILTAPATPQRHQRTDSSHIVLEHLKEQEHTNIFVQHKALMLGSPHLPSSLAPYAEVQQRRGGSVESKPSSKEDSLPAKPAAPPQRRASSAHSAVCSQKSQRNIDLPRKRAQSAGNDLLDRTQTAEVYAQELALAQRFTATVRQFNTKQQRELLELDERLQTALLNKTVGRRAGRNQFNAVDATLSGNGPAPRNFQQTAELLRQVADAAVRGGPSTAPTAHTENQHRRMPSAGSSRRVTTRTYESLKLQQVTTVTTAGDAHMPTMVTRRNSLSSAKPAALTTVPAVQPLATNFLNARNNDDTHTTATTTMRSTISTTLEDVVRRIAATMDVIPPNSQELRTLFVSRNSSEHVKAVTPQIFFRSGVRLSASQVEEFLRLVKAQQRGHTLQDAHVAELALGILSPRNASIARRTAALPSQAQEQKGGSGDYNGGKAVSVKHSSEQRFARAQDGLPRGHRCRTDVLRSLFDLLDIEGKGCITRSELTPLLHLVITECGDSDNEGATSHLLRASASHKAATNSAFSPLKGNSASPTSSGRQGKNNLHAHMEPSKQQLQHGRFHCEDAATFVKYCRLAAFAVIPILERSELDVWEFPHVGMLVSAELRRGTASRKEIPSSPHVERRTLEPLLAALCD
ncbi:Hypothetical protein, putative [Bodo saltans]|uniref:EF-hand domain-containing protein n=1 Tax=Bodo saltans TaxID=75058 RepID=A0A0S4KIK0_BODSA|nr:Hypothetical protein, putative [Bodo saltans]|eukprot:CUI14266.1 Hypothetical protein, putative [Bodo saltans]